MQKNKKLDKLSLETDFTNSGMVVAIGVSALIILVSVLMIYISTPPEKIYAAKVNGNPIMLHEYEKAIQNGKRQYENIRRQFPTFSVPSDQELQKNALDGVIERELYFQYGEKHDVTFSSSELEEEFSKFKEKNFGGNDKAFKDALKANHLNLSDFKESLRKDKLFDRIKKVVLDEKMRISDKEKKDYFEKNKAEYSKPEQVKASHILVKEEKKANEILEELKKGGKFNELAKKYSTDTGSKDKGGDLGFFGKGAMVPEFEKAVWALAVGKMTDKPIKSQFGYHIIMKTAFQAGRQDTFEEAKTKVEEKLKESKEKEVLDKFVKEEKANSKIITYVGAAPGELVTKEPTPAPTVSAPATDVKKDEVKPSPTKEEKKPETKKEDKKEEKASPSPASSK